MLADWLYRNEAADPALPWGPGEGAVLSLQALAEVERALALCPLHRPTPLYSLAGLARQIGVGQILYKDEAHRLGFGTFKALGGVYAVGRQLLRGLRQQAGIDADFADLVGRRFAAQVSQFHVAAASSGNHGRAVAAGARLFGCAATIVLPGFTSAAKEALIRARGADVLRIDGDYDTALRYCREIALQRGWQVIADTSWPGYVDIPRDVMQAYAVIAGEMLRQPAATRPTHLLLQAGVGGLAAGVAGTLRQALGAARPSIVVVEPQTADCFMQTARLGRPAPASGDASTAMGGLACREISPEAWTVLAPAADWFCTVPDSGVAAALRTLAEPVAGDRPIAAGPSGSAGLQALLRIAADGQARRALGLNSDSVVALIGSEGAAGDPDYFLAATGCTVASVEAAGASWDAHRAGRP